MTRGSLSTAYKTLGSKRPAVDCSIVVYCSSVNFATSINATMSLYSIMIFVLGQAVVTCVSYTYNNTLHGHLLIQQFSMIKM